MIPIELKPLKNEILTSWLIRNAIANGIDPIGFTNSIWFDYRAWTRDIARHLPKDKIHILAKEVSLSFNELFDLTLESVLAPLSTKTGLNPKKSWEWVIPVGIRNRSRTNGLYFCPECLQEKPIFLRNHWRLSWNFACHKHRCVLQLNCPQCHTVFSAHLASYTNTDITLCQHCSFDLKKSSFHPSDRLASELQEFMNSALENQSFPHNNFPHIDSSVKDFFVTIRILIIFFRTLPRHKKTQYVLLRALGLTHLNPCYSPAKGNTIDSVSANERHYLFVITSRLFTLTLKEVIILFRKSGVTKEMISVRGIVPSQTITHISSRLSSKTRDNFTPARQEQSVQAKDKQTVELLMSDIRTYL